MKNLGISLLYFFSIIVLGCMFITLFNYFNILSSNIISILKFLIPLIGILVSGFVMGKNSSKKGYIEGLKLGSIIVIVLIVISLLFNKFNVRSVIYYFVLLFSSILSSMFGINKKKDN